MTEQSAANDLLMNGGSGIKSAKFVNLMDVVRGTITDDPKVTQCMVFDAAGKPTSEKQFWPSGDPMMQIVVTIQTDERDPADDDDNGKRLLHITPRLQPAVRDAVKAAGAKGLAVGGRLAVQWNAGSGQGQGNARQYAAAYEPPQVGADLLTTNATPPLTAAPPAPVAQTAPAAPVSTMDLLKAPADDTPPPGIDPGKWAALPAAQKAAVRAAMAPTGDNIPF